jgi:hypothetical protein
MDAGAGREFPDYRLTCILLEKETQLMGTLAVADAAVQNNARRMNAHRACCDESSVLERHEERTCLAMRVHIHESARLPSDCSWL